MIINHMGEFKTKVKLVKRDGEFYFEDYRKKYKKYNNATPLEKVHINSVVKEMLKGNVKDIEEKEKRVFVEMIYEVY